MYGDGGNDYLKAREGAAFLSGGDGADVLYASSGNGFSGYAVFDGGKGDDTFSGSTLKNIYLFGLGSGRDTITAGSGAATIIMGAGILPADVLLRRDQLNPNTFRLEIKGTMDSITIPASSSSHLRSTVQFENGVIWTSVEFSQIVLQSASTGDDFLIGAAGNDVINGLGGNDTLWGKAGNDVLEGGAGNDNLLGWEGDDTLDGGAGNDSLGGMAGNDLYRFGKGSGNDTLGDGTYRGGNKNTAGDIETIDLASGILPQDIMVSRGGYQGADLIIAITGTLDTLTVSGWFDQDDNNTLKLKFADGTEWNAATINIKAPIAAPTSGIDYLYGDASNNVLNGAAGNDVIRGNAGNDVIDGGAGNDNLSGGSGSDTFIFGHGSGADTLFDYKELLKAEDSDVIQFTADVTPGDVTLSNNGSNLIIRLNGGTDSLTLASWSTTDNRVKQARFADGTVWNLTQSPGGRLAVR